MHHSGPAGEGAMRERKSGMSLVGIEEGAGSTGLLPDPPGVPADSALPW
jgi:hypothetical protein